MHTHSINRSWALAAALAVASVALFSFAASAQAQGVHGIGFAKGCDSPIAVGDPYECEYTINNNVDTGDGVTGDTLTITSIVDVIAANPSDETSANLLPLLTLTLSGGATCNPGQTLCTLPPGASISSDPYSFYNVDADDPSPLDDTAELTWQDLCTSGANNCPIDDRTSQAGSQVTIVEPLVIEKTAETSFERDWDWTIEKSADQTDLNLAEGETFTVNYEVTVGPTSEDSNHVVSGTVTVTNPVGNLSATVESISDALDAFGAVTLQCGGTQLPVVLSGGESINCTYSQSVPDDSDTENEVTVVTSGDVPGGSDTAAVVWGEPDLVTDDCVTVNDTNPDGPQDVVICEDDGDKTIEYSIDFGPQGDVVTSCGEGDHPNTADFVTNDNQETGDDDWTVHWVVDCQTGCTLTQGYWKTHSDEGPAPFDDGWDLLPGGLAEATVFFGSGKTWLEAFRTPVAGKPYYQLAHQYMAAKLNILNGATPTPAVTAAILAAEALFTNALYDTAAEIDALKGKNAKDVRAQFTSLAGTLGSFNEGSIGPGHCDEQIPT